MIAYENLLPVTLTLISISLKKRSRAARRSGIVCMVVPCLYSGGIHVYPFCVPWFDVYGEDWTGMLDI